MAECPKCGTRLRLYQWRPECPKCGVNMVYYKSNERLLAETEKAEIEHAIHQPSIDRAKAAFFGSPAAIARIVLSLLPIGALFLPLARYAGPEGEIAVNAARVYGYISDTGFQTILNGVLKGNYVDFSVLLLLISVVLILVCLICLPMSLGRRGRQRNLILNLCMLFSGAGALGCWIMGKQAPDKGIYVYLGVVFAILVYNLVLSFVGLKIRYTQCYIGGLPSEEYFSLVEQGASDLEIRLKMVDALTVMQEDARRRAAEEQARAEALRASRK